MSTAAPEPTTFTQTTLDLNQTFEALHTAKEDAFWTAYMGLSEDPEAARATLSQREIALQQWLQDPARLTAVKTELVRAEAALEAAVVQERPTMEEVTTLRGWLATFTAHTIDDPAAQALATKIVGMEEELANARGAMDLGYQVTGEEFTAASSVKLSALVSNAQEPELRKAAWEGLASIEQFVLANGFIELVKARNRLGRMLGGEDYYDWKVRRTEGLTKAQIFAWLDELEELTRDAAWNAIQDMIATEGPENVCAWNLRYLLSGDLNAELDPYFPFSKALERWGESFAALNISYNGSELVLDLLDRKGKYENGFMHGPVPSWRDRGTYRPARIQFTANAIPGMVGVGLRATETLFHEGGHAAHFANIDMPSPCFAQEFAPTSVAMAETQSMFLDSLLGDADWRTRYAKTVGGESLPFALIEKGIRKVQPFAAWSLRAMLAVCYCEKALYEIPEEELTAERILEVFRATECRLLFLPDGSPRPALAVPHLLSGESSAYYHGYVLAEMAVYQTRAFFLERDGHLTDNPRIGPDLRAHYWEPGNSKTFAEFIKELTGKPLSAEAIAAKVTCSVDDAVAHARAAVERLASVPSRTGPVELGGTIRVMHGNEEITSTAHQSFAVACQEFEAWVDQMAAVPA